jgi:transcriptional regulator with XRE-family HTH domain
VAKSLPARFGDRVRELRRRKGISQEALADLAGLHRTYLGGIERGERNPDLVNIGRIADALGVPLAELFAFNEAKSKSK